MANIVLIAYGFFLILGGFLGFKKGSKVSLIMGVSSGILIFLGVGLMTFALQAAWDYLACLNLLLTVTFLLRVIKTRAFMPAGMLLAIALAVLVFCLIQLK